MSAEERREQLLDTTKELVGERGFHGLSVEAVATRAGVSRPIVYGHFGDLEGLLEAMLGREGEIALRQLASARTIPNGPCSLPFAPISRP